MSDQADNMSSVPSQGLDQGPTQQVAVGAAVQGQSSQRSYLHQFALFYASHGMKVFPLVPGTKDPMRGSHAYLDATTDTAKIDAWWFANPSANIGWWPGGNGYAVIDCDTKHGIDGIEQFQVWFASNTATGDIPPTLAQDTTTGGRHYVFKLPVAHTVSDRNPWIKGIDVKSAGGYVVLAPSVLANGLAYKWQSGDQEFDLAHAAPMPSELLGALASGAPGASEGGESPIAGIPTELLLDGILDGQRGDILWRTACRLWTQTGDRITVALRILHAAREAVPPYPEAKAKAIIKRACSYPRGEVPDYAPDEDRPALQDAIDAKFKVDKEERKHRLRVESAAREDLELERRGRPGGYTLISDAEIADRPAPTWLIPGLLPDTGLFQFYGETGSYKSFVVQDLLRCVATGERWLGHYVVNKTGPVVYVAAEGSFDLGERRLAWIAAHNGVVPDLFYSLLDEGVDLMLRHDIEGLIELMRGLDPVMIVFDTQALHMASGDEDRAKDIGVVVSHMKRLANELGAVVGTVHHTGKDKTKGGRGSSAGPAAWDSMFEVTKYGVIPKKVKSGALPPGISIQMRTVDLGVNELGEPRSSLVPQRVDKPVVNLGTAAGHESDRERRRREIIVDVVRAAPGLSFTGVRTAANEILRQEDAGMTNDTYKSIFEELTVSGAIVHIKKKCFVAEGDE